MGRMNGVAAVLLAALTVVVPFGPPAALAQETTGALLGLVRSSDGLPLPGGIVTVANPENGLSLQAASSGSSRCRRRRTTLRSSWMPSAPTGRPSPWRLASP